MSRSLLLLLIPLTGLALLAAGCGQTTKEASPAAEEPKPDNELSVETAGWKTDFGNARGRRGVIEAVLEEQPSRYQVRREDGHTSVLAPSAGSASIEQKKRPRMKAKA